MNPNNDAYWSSRDNAKGAESKNREYDDWDSVDEVESQPKPKIDSKKKKEKK